MYSVNSGTFVTVMVELSESKSKNFRLVTKSVQFSARFELKEIYFRLYDQIFSVFVKVYELRSFLKFFAIGKFSSDFTTKSVHF